MITCALNAVSISSGIIIAGTVISSKILKLHFFIKFHGISDIIRILEVYPKLMKPNINFFRSFMLVLILIPVLNTGHLALAQSGDELQIHEDWQLKKDKDGIRIYTRWIEAEEGRMARQMRAVMAVDASMDASVKALTDDEQVRKWLNRAKEYYHFEKTDQYHWYAYTQFKIPWPLDNQDLITFNTLELDRNKNTVSVILEGRPDHRPEIKGVQRMSGFEGAWEFIPDPQGGIEIEYMIFTRAKPVLPRWIIDPIVEYGLWNTFAEMQKLILENDAGDVKLSFLSD